VKEVFSMREIKFRAWLKKENKMVEVKSLHLGTRKIIYGYSETSQCYGNKSCSFDDIELMQCTDIKDRNGKEIYEGDILKVDNYIMYGEGSKEYQEVGFEYGSFMTARYGGKAFNTYLWIIVSDGCEVVGNIYENPELLGVE